MAILRLCIFPDCSVPVDSPHIACESLAFVAYAHSSLGARTVAGVAESCRGARLRSRIHQIFKTESGSAMTSNSTENYRPPLYATVVSLLTQLKTPLFNRAIAVGEGTKAGEECFEMWYFLSALADRIARSKSVDLGTDGRQTLTAALLLLHDLAHDVDLGGTPHVAECRCNTAERIKALETTIEAYRVQIAGQNAAA